MIDQALKFLRRELNAFFQPESPADPDADGNAGATVQLSWIQPVDGDPVAPPPVGITLLRVEEEHAAKTPVRTVKGEDSIRYRHEPPLCVNLYVLFSTFNTDYSVAIENLSRVVEFFQARRTFTSAEYPGLPDAIGVLRLELRSLDYEQQSYIWSGLGGKMLPAVIYKVRMLTIQTAGVEAETAPVRRQDTLGVGA